MHHTSFMFLQSQVLTLITITSPPTKPPYHYQYSLFSYLLRILNVYIYIYVQFQSLHSSYLHQGLIINNHHVGKPYEHPYELLLPSGRSSSIIYLMFAALLVDMVGWVVLRGLLFPYPGVGIGVGVLVVPFLSTSYFTLFFLSPWRVWVQPASMEMIVSKLAADENRKSGFEGVELLPFLDSVQCASAISFVKTEKQWSSDVWVRLAMNIGV